MFNSLVSGNILFTCCSLRHEKESFFPDIDILFDAFFLMLFHFLDAMIETNEKIFIVTILFGNKRKVSKHFTNVIRAE